MVMMVVVTMVVMTICGNKGGIDGDIMVIMLGKARSS